jgi:type VI secretion system protein ImpM
MNSQSPTLGWFGKIPSLGDFATRNLPPSFVKPWDEWLSAELSEARFVWADSWATTYQQAPMLCFSLGAGAADDFAWQGILLPSFDRVGREFPLTIAQSRPRLAATTVGRQWWVALAAAGRRALEPGCGADGVDKALAVFVDHQPEPGHCAQSDVQRMEPASATVSDGTSAWWPWSVEDSPEVTPAVFAGLPRGVCFRKLLGAC